MRTSLYTGDYIVDTINDQKEKVKELYKAKECLDDIDHATAYKIINEQINVEEVVLQKMLNQKYQIIKGSELEGGFIR